jgi:hypothetical protein
MHYRYRAWGLCILLSALFQLIHAAEFQPAKQNHTQAYVTLLYGDDFLLGVRVLGQSLKDTGTNR